MISEKLGELSELSYFFDDGGREVLPWFEILIHQDSFAPYFCIFYNSLGGIVRQKHLVRFQLKIIKDIAE